MKKLFEKLKFRKELFTGRYKFFIAKTKTEIEGCIRVLEEVRRKELNRVSGKSVLDSGAFGDNELNYQLAACRDTKTGKIVGCVRLTEAFETKNIPSSNREYQLDLFPNEILKKIKIYTRLAVLKSYRKTPAGLVMIVNCFKADYEKGYLGVLMSCEPSLFPMYQLLGFRQIGEPHSSPKGGYRVPMLLFADRNHMTKIKSPVMMFSRGFDFSKSLLLQNWYRNLERKHQNRQIGISTLENDATILENIDEHITKGLSKRGKKKFLKNAMVIKCKQDDVLVAENDGGRVFGIVKSGKVNVIIDREKVGELKKGDVFGEIAFVLNSKRTATLLAASSETEIVLFSLSAVKRLGKNMDSAVVWQNLAKNLAGRLVERTTSIAL